MDRKPKFAQVFLPIEIRNPELATKASCSKIVTVSTTGDELKFTCSPAIPAQISIHEIKEVPRHRERYDFLSVEFYKLNQPNLLFLEK